MLKIDTNFMEEYYEMKIKIEKDVNNAITFSYDENEGKILNFDELLFFSKYLIHLPNFKEIEPDEIIFENAPELELYKTTIYDLISSIQGDQELLEVISESKELDLKIEIESDPEKVIVQDGKYDSN